MDKNRWNFLMWDNDQTKEHNLTQEEADAGWHWCGDWDDLLIHPDDEEFKSCNCECMDKFRKNASSK